MDTVSIVNLLISLISGAIGGNVAGVAMKDKDSFGTAGNSVVGLLGGGLGSYILQALGILSQTGGSLDLTSILAHVGSGGVGGAILLALASIVKNALAKR